MNSFLKSKIYSQTYTTTYLYMHIALVFSVTPEPLSPCQRPSPTWARNCAETEAKASLQTRIRASGREQSILQIETQTDSKPCTNGVREAYRYIHLVTVCPCLETAVWKDLFPGCKYVAFKCNKVHTQVFVGPKLWKKRREKPLLCLNKLLRTVILGYYFTEWCNWHNNLLQKESSNCGST